MSTGGSIIRPQSVPSSVEARFESYREEVDEYEYTWFSEPEEPQKSYLGSRPELLTSLYRRAAAGKISTTRHVYAASGLWDKSRCDFQSDLLSQHAPSVVELPARAAVYFLIGLPGSGKSSALRPLVYKHAALDRSEIAVSDADDLRVKFPEYAGGKGSGVVQDECAELMYDRPTDGSELWTGFQGVVLESGRTAIVDVIGDPVYLPALITRLRNQRRKVFVLQSQCAVQECIRRAKVRALETGRLVPPELIAAKEGVPEKAMDAAIATGKLTGWAVVDTNGTSATIVRHSSFAMP
ncbi:zeta toxin family protein [Arthrobacter koreensis]|uniref:zeta toxin family protein n=1 Tax=Arthrobacter koreensis TaxID=199136 RepID=UPI0036DCA203